MGAPGPPLPPREQVAPGALGRGAQLLCIEHQSPEAGGRGLSGRWARVLQAGRGGGASKGRDAAAAGSALAAGSGERGAGRLALQSSAAHIPSPGLYFLS